MKLHANTNSIEIDNRIWPALIDRQDFEGKGYRYFHRRRQAVVIFENGWCVSVVWHNFSYSSNYGIGLDGEKEDFTEEPERVEIASWNHRAGSASEAGLVAWPDGDTVAGQVPVENLPTIFDFVAEHGKSDSVELNLDPLADLV